VKMELDDQILEHPKFVRAVKLAGPDALFLWMGLRAYCSRFLTDGAIPLDMVDEVKGPKDPERRANALEALKTSNLVEDVPDGVYLHDYLDHAPSREQILAWRKANSDRKAKSRGVSRCESQRDYKRDTGVSHSGSHGVTTSGVPAPSDPVSCSYSDDLDLAKAAASAQDLTASARVEPPKPRRQQRSEVELEPSPEQASLPRQAASGPREAAPGRAESIPTSERQPEALPTRRQRQASDLEGLPIGELAKRWRENPTWVAVSAPQHRQELASASLAWDTAVGLAHRPLGDPGRDNGTRALLELFADGVDLGEILRACKQAGRDDWICGRSSSGRPGDTPRKRRIDCLSHAVLRRLLDAADATQPRNLNPLVAKMLADEAARNNA
jgi:hypothetical protein